MKTDIRAFFRLVETIFLALEPNFYQFFRDFLKWKQLFRVVETYFSIFFIRLLQTDFLPIGNGIFLFSAISLLVETIIGIRRERAH